jgi:carbon-monoxide dehydrogenase medium subunit
MKFHHPASGFAVTGVMVSKTGSDVRVAVTGAGPSVFRVPEMEAALAKNFAPDAVANIKVDPSPLMSDIQRGLSRPPRHRHGQARGGSG